MASWGIMSGISRGLSYVAQLGYEQALAKQRLEQQQKLQNERLAALAQIEQIKRQDQLDMFNAKMKLEEEKLRQDNIHQMELKLKDLEIAKARMEAELGRSRGGYRDIADSRKALLSFTNEIDSILYPTDPSRDPFALLQGDAKKEEQFKAAFGRFQAYAQAYPELKDNMESYLRLRFPDMYAPQPQAQPKLPTPQAPNLGERIGRAGRVVPSLMKSAIKWPFTGPGDIAGRIVRDIYTGYNAAKKEEEPEGKPEEKPKEEPEVFLRPKVEPEE